MSSHSGDTTRLRGWADRLRAGDHAALDELLVHFGARLTRLARRMLKGFPVVHRAEQTDDVLQKASIRLLKALQKVPLPQDTRHFFRLAALQMRRELIDLAEYYDRRAHLGPCEAPEDPPASGEIDRRDRPDDTDDPSQLAEWTEFHEMVEALPEAQQEAFDLIYYGGLSKVDAAEVLGVSRPTVDVNWLKARLTIGRAFEGRMPGS